MKKNIKNLYEILKGLTDIRRKQGMLYPLPIVLLIAIFGIMNGAKSERAISRFAENNKEDLIKCLQLKKERIPTRNIIRAVLANINFKELEELFYKWSKTQIKIEKNEWVSIDGKALRGTMSGKQTSQQRFKSLISLFISRKKQCLKVSKIDTKKTNEIPAVQEMIKLLDLENVVFTIDAMHCQKKTTKIIKESKNEYIIGVKGNQKKLLKQVKKT